MAEPTAGFSLNVLTINTHKGFTAFNRRFILPELRDAVRSVSADIVCLQEVMGAHEVHPLHIENWPDTTHYEFLADTMWSDYAYGRNAVYPEGHHGNAVLSRVLHNNLLLALAGLVILAGPAVVSLLAKDKKLRNLSSEHRIRR